MGDEQDEDDDDARDEEPDKPRRYSRVNVGRRDWLEDWQIQKMEYERDKP